MPKPPMPAPNGSIVMVLFIIMGLFIIIGFAPPKPAAPPNIVPMGIAGMLPIIPIPIPAIGTPAVTPP
jgi:hypothetical protein